jgi:hypothetical protein
LAALRTSIEEEVRFKSELSCSGIVLDMSSLKNAFLDRLRCKCISIYKHYHDQFEQLGESLWAKLREKIVIEIDHLSTYHAN